MFPNLLRLMVLSGLIPLLSDEPTEQNREGIQEVKRRISISIRDWVPCTLT
jgi:hypothetical protein